MNGELLREIEINLDSSKPFIEALCEDEQDHIAKFIVTAGCETDSDERLLPRELRKVIDDNMFCLEKLIDTERRYLLYELAKVGCITARHRDRVMNFKPDEEKAYQLLIIIQRRRYKDFFNFIKCKEMEKNIVKILEKGGITEIKIKFREEQSEKKHIVAELIRKLRGHVDGDLECDLDGEQQEKVVEFLAELAENDISFIGICPETSTSNSDLSMFFQGEKEDPFPAMKSDCESGSIKTRLEKLYRSLLKVPDRWPPLVKEVTLGQHSSIQRVITHTKEASGNFSFLIIE